jgi:hypothetical protein
MKPIKFNNNSSLPKGALLPLGVRNKEYTAMSKERLTAEEMLEKSFNSSDLRRITYIPDIKAITDLMQSFARQEVETAIAERMPTELINTAEWLLMDSTLKCPHCGGVGFTVKPNYYTGEPEQEQCRWCHEFEWFRSRMEEKK